MLMCAIVFFFFKQKTAYEMRISDWSSDVCSSDLARRWFRARGQAPHHDRHLCAVGGLLRCLLHAGAEGADADRARFRTGFCKLRRDPRADRAVGGVRAGRKDRRSARSEEHTSELQSLMRSSYAVVCLKNKKKK